MKKPFKEEHDFQQLNHDIVWSEERKAHLQKKIIKEVDQLEGKTKEKRSWMYATSIASFIFLIFVGYQFTFDNGTGHERTLVTEEEPKITEGEEIVIEVEPEQKLNYYGTYDETGLYETVAMTDTNAMYFIPVTISDVRKETVASLNFNTSEKMKKELRDRYELSPARSDIPLQDVKMDGSHLHLYFKKEDLNQARGSTGVSMAAFSISTFAENWSKEVERYTGYGDGEPFEHEGEEFSLINVPVVRSQTLVPVNTGKAIFLRNYWTPVEKIDDLFTTFFTNHERPDFDYPIDLSMFSVEKIEGVDGIVSIFIEGDATDHALGAENLHQLLAHGLGANIHSNPDLFEQPVHHSRMYLNDKIIFDGKLAGIRVNYLELVMDKAAKQDEVAAVEEVIVSKAETAFRALEMQHWQELSTLVHPQKELLFSHYAYVDKDEDQRFTKEEVANFSENEQAYLFGSHHAKDNQDYVYTPKDYINNILLNFEYFNLEETKVDYTEVSFDTSLAPTGGIINNIKEAYPDGKYVEYYAPYPSDEQFYLWQGLRFVFEQENNQWYLVAIVRDIHSP